MILGMDFSSLAETERLGGRFYDRGKEGDLVDILADNGINYARLRLWNDPFGPNGEHYGGGTNDIECLVSLAKRAREHGMKLLLDLHYSDFWCDPARQLPPKAWRGMSLDALCDAVYGFTRDSIERLCREGLCPDMVQVGNEITNGMLWDTGRLTDTGGIRAGYDNLAKLLKAGIEAVRDSCDAKVMLHLERSGDNAVWREWFTEITKRNVEFDIIGASYYPFWHGTLAGLKANMDDMAERFDKDIIIVETAYAFTSEHFCPDSENTALVINDSLRLNDGTPAEYPLTLDGQRDFVRDLLDMTEQISGSHGKGVFYWEPAWLPVEGSTWATQAAREYINETHKKGGNEWANQCIFDYAGNANPALYEFLKYANK